MFQHFSGRTSFLIHASLGVLCFTYMAYIQVEKAVDLSAQARELQLSEDDRKTIHQEQMTQASRISLVFSSVFFFLMSVWLMTQQTEMNFGIVQRSTLGKRLDFTMTLSLYIAFFSSLFNAVQLMDDDNILGTTLDGEPTVLDLGRPVEWMLTCPLIQLAIPVLGGEKVPDSRRITMPILSFSVLAFGLAASLAETLVIKALLYCGGLFLFCCLLYFMNACVSESSNGGESLINGTSFLRSLVVVVAVTWIPFPVWYALSPEGFNIIKDEPGMKVAVAFLNVFSKGAFITYLARIRNDYRMREKTMISIGYIKSDGTFAKKGLEQDGDGDGTMEKQTAMLVEEVLDSMGRSKDKAFVIERLQEHLITSNDDVLSLTKDYCREIELPWGLVLALKSKIRSHHVQMDDPWSMQQGRTKSAELSFSAPHIAKNKDKIEHVKRRQSTEVRDDMSEMQSNFGYPSSALSTAPSVEPRTPNSAYGNSAFQTQNTQGSLAMPGGQNEEIHKILEGHQKNVNAQVDECRQFVMHSMDRIMNVLEERLTDVSQAQAGLPAAQPQPLSARSTA